MPAVSLPSPNVASSVDRSAGAAGRGAVGRDTAADQEFVPTGAEVEAVLRRLRRPAQRTVSKPAGGGLGFETPLRGSSTGGDPDELTAREAETLLHARGAHLDALLEIAGRVRDEGLANAGRPGIITYSRKVFIPLTHLCQDRCHYCIFVQSPGKLAKAGKAPYLSADEVLEVARQGAALGCKEALFTLGDRPENRWAVAREWLDAHGYASTIDYVGAMAKLVLDETGLLPHLNPGVMTWAEIQRLRPVAPSMGMMLETTATRLWSEKGGPHFGSPDKDPAVRLRVLDEAGRSKVPFTTGVLFGIGENYAERIESLHAIRASARLHGHIQETIVQNFRAKESTAMMATGDLDTHEYAAAVAVARLVMGPDARIQTPPNLTDTAELALLVRAGIDDWGGVSPLTPDHVNPERPWPQIDALAELTAANGYELRERLTAHPEYLRAGDEWIDPGLRGHIEALMDAATGLAEQGAIVSGRLRGETAHARDDDALVGVSRRLASRGSSTGDAFVGRAAHTGESGALLAHAERSPSGLGDADYEQLLRLRGADLDELSALADAVRRERVGDSLTFVVNRNLDPSLDLSSGSVRALVDEAWMLGATEICAQGSPTAQSGPDAHAGLARAVKAAAPGIHLHAFRPVELLDGAARAGLPLPEFLAALRDAGVDSVPGTGARILDDDVRALLTGGTDLSSLRWVEIMRTAHRAGLRSTSTMIYGHVETPRQIVAHLRTLISLHDETGGFSEFIAMPFVPSEAADAVRRLARPGPSLDESRAVHAVSRLMLAGRIDHIQAAWTKLGLHGAQSVLEGGADDLGGLLLDGTLDPSAGAEGGRALTRGDAQQMASRLGRQLRQRTTLYGFVAEGRVSP